MKCHILPITLLRSLPWVKLHKPGVRSCNDWTLSQPERDIPVEGLHFHPETILMKLFHCILTAANFVNPFLLWRDLGAETSLRNSHTLLRSPPSKRIAVVGGGTSGLSFLKVSKEYQKKYNLSWEVILYEQRHDIGGIWCVVLRV